MKTFIGHSTDVQSLVLVQINDEPCVLSAAAENRLIHAWYVLDVIINGTLMRVIISIIFSRLLSTENQDRGAFASFAMDDALMSLSVRSLSTGEIRVLACSRTGVLQVYDCVKNG